MSQIKEFHCLRCGYRWEAEYNPDKERTCPKCRSNSVRVKEKTAQKQTLK